MLYVGRNGTSTRRLNEENVLIDKLKSIASNNNWFFEIFDDGKSGMAASQRTFSSASVVIGKLLSLKDPNE
jgi:hypothetical protein